MSIELTVWETEPLREGYDPEMKEGEFKIAPAKWIWLPSQRTLPCTFVLFRKEFDLEKVPKVARGWIAADSRYILYVNGKRVQFGPAPHDPRHAEADPVDIAPYLRKGTNVIGIHVLFYGQGDGTWPTGKPGLLFRVNVGKEVIASDKTWMCSVDRGHKPGGNKRWYLRALQEDYQASNFSHGWNQIHYQTDRYWYHAQELAASSTATPISGPYPAYNEDIWMVEPRRSTLLPRSIPMMREEMFIADLVASHRMNWTGNPNDWFDFRVPGLFATEPLEEVYRLTAGAYLLTYKLPFTMVGWPSITFKDAEKGIVEVICQESMASDQVMLDTGFFSWSRFRLDRQQQVYECFDYESCQFIQLHVEVPKGFSLPMPEVRFRRRTLIDAGDQFMDVSSKSLERVLNASLVTLRNSAQDIVVDGMGRERQQYAGDGAHQLHAVRQAHGEYSLSKRFLTQFGYGQMLNGVWFDSWPAYDRYARLGQRQIGLSGWGSLVDHSVGFVIEHVNHWLQTGDRTPFEANRDKIYRFLDYFPTITCLDGLLRVENLDAEAVWMDHDAYHEQSHKKLAFNLYAMQMMAMLAWIEGLDCDLSFQIDAVRKQYWHEKVGALINNRFEVASRPARYCDRSISHLLWLHAHGYSIVPDLTKTIDIVTKQPKSLGISYPANSVWRHWAWARIGRVDLILKEFEERWAPMHSVQHNTTIQEMWHPKPGSTALMSHCAVSPTMMMHQAVLGVGQDREGNWFIRPQLADMESFSIRSHTPWGAIHFQANIADGFHICVLHKPEGMPLSIRTVSPVDLPFHDRGKEFSTDVTDLGEVTFEVQPYPQDQLIVEIES